MQFNENTGNLSFIQNLQYRAHELCLSKETQEDDLFSVSHVPWKIAHYFQHADAHLFCNMLSDDNAIF